MKNTHPSNSLKFYNFQGEWNDVIFVVQLLIRRDECIPFFYKNIYVQSVLVLKIYTKIQRQLEYDHFS
jgi:hypothetical protein